MLKRFLGDPWTRAYKRLRDPKTTDDIVLDEAAIENALRTSPIPVKEISLDPEDVNRWVVRVDYSGRHEGYYADNFAEKSLEHYFAAQLLNLQPEEVYIDIASQNGVASEIYERLYGVTAYAQDLDFEQGLHGRRIGGNAGELPLPENFADAMALHCSFEHFESESDMAFIREAGRVLKPGGRCAIVPLYLANKYCCLTDPSVSVPGGVEFEEDLLLVASRSYKNRHGRFYDVQHLIDRVWHSRGPLETTAYIVKNFHDIASSCYLRYALLLEKRL